MNYIIAIDQSTSGTKAALYNMRMETVRVLRRSHQQYYPHPGWAEHDAEEIWENTAALLTELVEGIEKSNIVGVGIANQRETCVIWERSSGRPVHRAVVWQDVRAKYITEPMSDAADEIYSRTGLMPSPYYSAAKWAAVLHDNPALKTRAQAGELCFGTIDSYLLYRLTGGKSFCSDYTNACRTQLFDSLKLEWSEELCRLFGIPRAALSEKLMPADSRFGTISTLPALYGVEVLAMLGDSHASLFGHRCIRPGMVKTSFGTGSSIMMNVGSKPLLVGRGLSSSVGFAYGGRVDYVVEGNVTCSADTLIWVKDYLHLVDDMSGFDEAGTVSDTDGVYFVPAFSGLGAPWWKENARAIIYGMNRGTTRAHILRAALASIAHQNADVMDAMQESTGISISCVHADGGGCANPVLMQMQSDLIPCRVTGSMEKELTLRGIGIMTGISAGVFNEDSFEAPEAKEYMPQMDEEARRAERDSWADTIRRCI